jgi:cytochrome c oxidase subunit 3
MSMPGAGITVEKHRDYTGAKMGMWLFLFTELLLFGGMFLLYSVYRSKHPGEFHNAAAELDTMIGTLNTLILLTSSLTMALSIAAIHRGNKKLCIILISVTILLGLVFLTNKYFEWGAKFSHGIYPNSEHLLQYGKGEILFFGLYFTMTGLHGLHVLIGLVILAVMIWKINNRPRSEEQFDEKGVRKLRGARLKFVNEANEELWNGEEVDGTVKEITIHYKYHAVPKRIRVEDFAGLETSGLYWHLVDIIWIFLFPLFYLIT